MQESLRHRLTFGPLMLAGLFGLLYLDSWIEKHTGGWVKGEGTHQSHGVAGVGVFLLLMLILPRATTELASLFTAEHVKPYRFLAATGSGLLAMHAFLTQFYWFRHIGTSTLAFIIVFTMILAAIRRASAKETHEAITRMAGTVLAMLYLGGLGWFLLALRVKHSDNPLKFQGSTQAVLMILLVVKFTDIGAFFGGRTFGRHKLIPWLSPGKTWEGLFCGMVTAALIGLGCSLIWPHHLATLTWDKALIFGAVIGGVGQAGDLLESLMKRDADVKDSGKLVPGFGGLLDIIDSPLLGGAVCVFAV